MVDVARMEGVAAPAVVTPPINAPELWHRRLSFRRNDSDRHANGKEVDRRINVQSPPRTPRSPCSSLLPEMPKSKELAVANHPTMLRQRVAPATISPQKSLLPLLLHHHSQIRPKLKRIQIQKCVSHVCQRVIPSYRVTPKPPVKCAVIEVLSNLPAIRISFVEIARVVKDLLLDFLIPHHATLLALMLVVAPMHNLVDDGGLDQLLRPPGHFFIFTP